tara:strand:+ start:2505 stop:2876 length:372 start_codon:yes stop_codon:yes gene_type:complete
MATKKKKKVGRKKVEFDWDKFDSILQFKPPKQVCSDILGISEDSIERRIKEEYDCTFSEYRARRMGPMKIRLAQKIIQMALNGNVPCLIFCAKVYLGWSDKPIEEQNKEVANVVLNIPSNQRE